MSHDHFEPELGLPERLPTGEHKLWQGSPDWRWLARHVFHWNKLALYFGLILLWRAGLQMHEGAAPREVLDALLRLAPLFGLALGLLALVAWLSARTTVYTLTDRRVVMRVGIVLTVTYNLPLRSVDAAHVRGRPDGRGDIALALKPGTRIAYLHLWPHARPWHLVNTQPMLRGLPDVQHTAELLTHAWSQVNRQTAQPAAPAAERAAPQALAPQLMARS